MREWPTILRKGYIYNETKAVQVFNRSINLLSNISYISNRLMDSVFYHYMPYSMFEYFNIFLMYLILKYNVKSVLNVYAQEDNAAY